MNEVRAGVILSFLTLALTNIVALVLTPYMLRSFGQSEYGLYVLIGTLVSHLSLLDLGLGTAVVRYVAHYRAMKDRRAEENFLATCAAIYGLIGLLIIGAGAALYHGLPMIFPNLTPTELELAQKLFIVLIIDLAVSIPGSIFQSICTGYEHYFYPRLFGVARICMRSLCLFGLLLFGYRAFAVVLMDALFNAARLLSLLGYVFFRLKVRLVLHHFERAAVRELFGYSFWIFVGVLVDQLYWRLGQTILGIIADTSVVAIFAIGIQLTLYLAALSTAISSVFLPRAAAMEAANAPDEEVTGVMIRVGRMQFLVLGCAFTGFVCLGRLFIKLWAGPAYLTAWPIALIMMVPLMLPLVQNYGIALLQARNKHAVRSLMYLSFAVVNIFIGYLLAKQYGGLGMAAGTALSLIMGQGFAINFYYHFRMGLNIPRFFKELSAGLGLAFLLVLAAGLAIAALPGSSWTAFCVKSAALVAVYAGLMWSFGMRKDEKQLVISLLHPLKNIAEQTIPAGQA
ncbi:MAG TPA: oligosaccharide flippase family protein [Oligoflexia bacterium]|nr:oligosaccharide flippase family protein [Oligoflexia bacterium]